MREQLFSRGLVRPYATSDGASAVMSTAMLPEAFDAALQTAVAALVCNSGRRPCSERGLHEAREMSMVALEMPEVDRGSQLPMYPLAEAVASAGGTEVSPGCFLGPVQ
jgi:hypothetical protein